MTTKRAIWLHTNRRAVWSGLFVMFPFLAVAIGCALMSPSEWTRWAGVVSASILVCLSAVWAYLMFPPRLTYTSEQLHVRLRPGPPIQVPIDVVECFFLGQGPALLARPFGDHDQVEETSTIVVRLAESAEAWKQFDVKPALGLWCDGYITIRGTWCEPITNDLLKHLNESLIAAHRKTRSGTSNEVHAESEPALPTREQEVG